MKEVELGREEDDVVFTGAGEPGVGGVEGCCCVFDAAVVGWCGDDDFVLGLLEVVGDGVARKREHVQVHLGGEALGRAVRGDPAGEGDETFC